MLSTFLFYVDYSDKLGMLVPSLFPFHGSPWMIAK